MRNLVLLLFAVVVSIQTSGLKIVVIEGEGAVNIIQQKSAVAPIVEVRDRNNLPVPGATVTFAIEGGKAASFGGANTLTLTTNAAGRAAAAGFNPISSGAVHINVSAAFQGQTVAASIAQTNVMTAAEAASAAGASSAGGAAGGAAGGGGISTGAIVGIVGGVGAAAAGGIVVAGKSSGGGPGNPAPGIAGNTTTSITSGATTTTSIPATNPTNPTNPTTSTTSATSSAPTTTTTLPTCQFTASPTKVSMPVGGGSFVVLVTVSPTPCERPTWEVNTIGPSFTVDRTSGTGNGSVTVTMSAFTPAPNFPSRCDALSVASTTVSVVQPTDCR